MDRRDFFRRGLGKATETVVRHVDEKITQRVSWIRPPFALSELEFLLACTRCDACITACPYDVIFPLPARLGPEIIGTPALDLLNKACHLCEDWPCVTACEPKALQLPENDQPGMPQLATVSINPEACLPYLGPECGACRDSCPVENALQWQAECPVVNSDYCTGCALCREACILEPKAIEVKLKSSTV